MQPALILLPAIALAGWTMLVLLLIPYRRFKAAHRGEVKVQDFEFGEADCVPGYVSLANRNYMNLLELPTLFYFISLVYFLLQEFSVLALGLAWLYVLLRLCHSFVHLSYNNVMHRLSFFAASNLVLLAYLATLAFVLVGQVVAN